MLRVKALSLSAGLTMLLASATGAVRAQDVIHGDVRPIAQTSVRLVVDSPQPIGQLNDAAIGATYRLTGWVADLRARSGTGVRQLVVFLNGPSGEGRLLGWARSGLPRPDVGIVYNNPDLAASASGGRPRWEVANG